MSPGRLLPFGERAVLVELADLDTVMAFSARLEGLRHRGGLWSEVEDVVPAARTVLVTVGRADALDPVRTAVTTQIEEPLEPVGPASAEVVVIETDYDGPDLADVARLTGLTADQLVSAHTSATWRVAFGGFAPGFAYLVGDDPRLHVPRRDSPRTAVPAGSVGLAGEFSGVYPRASPGGWQLIGRTDAVLWDSDRYPPALLGPGATVRFQQAG